MIPENLKVLAERASSIDGRPAERLDEVHERIAHARRRRQIGAVAAAVVAVVLALTAGVGLLALTRTDDTPPATPAPRPTSTPSVLEEEPPSVRQLTYSTGHKIHWGDRVVDVGGKVWEIAATDTGVVFMRQGSQKQDCFRHDDGCNELWFTDGSEIVHIGTVYGSVIRGFYFQGSSSGSTAVWFEPSPEDHPHGSGYDFTGEWVVYDTHERREVARMGTPGRDTDRNGHPHLMIEAVFEDYVYWIPDDRAGEWCREYSQPGGMCLHHRAVMRLNVATGAQTKVPWSAYVADRLSRPRMFFASTYTADYPYNPTPGDHPGEEGVAFHRDGDRLAADYYGGSGAVTVRRAGAEERVRLRPPPGYFNDTNLWLMVGWLDDARVVLRADNKDDLLVCRLPDGRCRIAVRGVQQADFGSHG